MSAIDAMPDPAWLRVLDASGGAEGGPEIDLRGGEADGRIRALYQPPRRDWVRMNMIGSLNGRVTGPDGTSDTLSNRADRRILGAIRRMSDAIVVGAQTVRQERHTATAPTRLCVVTSSGDLGGHRISEREAAASVLVCCPQSAADRVRETMPGANIEALEPRDGRIPLGAVLDALRARGLHRIVVEGGNRLISQFLDEERLDEICLTQAPVFAPNDAPSLPGSGTGTRFDRALLLEDEAGFLYQRLLARREPG
ncbi:dihydrofolate reductase family protein [Gulosibacter sp. 10]|uniref:dihydrofolate reductase family protein n=1 Tax=Gulosibacter sp. 10 TaxID=1255570 RepID=UPI00097F18D0|nr:dihydrofolate reductase family protein [Gulosibacter sp. 10]SJM65837.1 5-amino-6-(5-phosphoribosylamino)uracil reductase homolog [Gulosibacter sp. 10]